MGCSKNWTEKEIESLSEQCGRYKETSSSFQESPAPLETQVGSNATIIVPRGHSVLVDETGKQVEVRLSMDQSNLSRSAPGPAGLVDRLRLKLGATPAELDDMVIEMLDTAKRFGIRMHEDWEALIAAEIIEDSRLPRVTLGVYEEESIDITMRLRSVRRSILGHGYTENNICQMLSVDSLQGIEPTRLHYYDKHLLPEAPLADLVRLFQLRVRLSHAIVLNRFLAMKTFSCLRPWASWSSKRTYFGAELICFVLGDYFCDRSPLHDKGGGSVG